MMRFGISGSNGKRKKQQQDFLSSQEDSQINPLASLQSIKHLNYVSDNVQTSKLAKSWAIAETKVVNVLRVAVIISLIVAAVVVASGVYVFTRNGEEQDFHVAFEDSAHQVIDSFHEAIERNMAAVASLSNSITSYALESNSSFPYVTLPNFEIKGSDIRAQSGSHLLHWCPLVNDQTRGTWEEYSFQNRHQAKQAIQNDAMGRMEQDQMYGYTRNRRHLQATSNTTNTQQQSEHEGELESLISTETQGVLGVRPTTLNDGSNFHPYIWSAGATSPRGDIPQGQGDGKYMPIWQQSPADPRLESALNLDTSRSVFVTRDLINTMETEQLAILNMAAEPREQSKKQFEYYLSISQYRHRAKELVDDWHTLLSYPVFDSFDVQSRNVAGMITTDIYWKIFFSNLLPTNLRGLICVITNSFNQTFSYQIDGTVATALGYGDPHEAKYQQMALSTNINTHLSQRAGPENRAYKTVHLSDTVQYTIHVYPSKVTEDLFVSSQPAVYAVVVVLVFVFAGTIFIFYSVVVEHRQQVMNDNVIDKVKKAAETERELNEFLSHEIRNPLSAAISACTFVSTAVNEANPLSDEESRIYVRDDIEVVNASLHFINDFLRSMLDIYRASGNQITVEKAPTDIKHDILEPVSNILYKRLATYDVLVECPDNLVVMTDSIRLKQVILNLVRNASKFVEKGFLRMRAEVITEGLESRVCLYVEDSGPGIPPEKKRELFAKYQDSLDLLSQGTGIGLNLAKKLCRIMGGELSLDDDYDSGIEGAPGACFVVDLNTPPLDLDQELDMGDFDYTEPTDIETGHAYPTNDATTRTESPGESASSVPNVIPEGVEQSQFPPPARKADPDPVLPEGLKVLFVDDDAMLRKLFVRAVKRASPASWTIKEASSGEMAIKILTEDPSIDLVFLDQYMASVDKQLLGTETASALRRKGIESKIIGLSANDLRTPFVNAGADDFILKPMPCKPEELKRLLHKFVKPKMDSSVRRFLDSSRRSYNSRSRSVGTKSSSGSTYNSSAPIPPLVTIPPVGILKKEKAPSEATASSSEAAPVDDAPKVAPLFEVKQAADSGRRTAPVSSKKQRGAADLPPLTTMKTNDNQQSDNGREDLKTGASGAAPLFAIAEPTQHKQQSKPLFSLSGTDQGQNTEPLFAINSDSNAPKTQPPDEQSPRKNNPSPTPLFALKGSDNPSNTKDGSREAETKGTRPPQPLFSMEIPDKSKEAKPAPLFAIGTPRDVKPPADSLERHGSKPAPLFAIPGVATGDREDSEHWQDEPQNGVAQKEGAPAPLFAIDGRRSDTGQARASTEQKSMRVPIDEGRHSNSHSSRMPPVTSKAGEQEQAPVLSAGPNRAVQDGTIQSTQPPTSTRGLEPHSGSSKPSNSPQPLFSISAPVQSNIPPVSNNAVSNTAAKQGQSAKPPARKSSEDASAASKKPAPLFSIASLGSEVARSPSTPEKQRTSHPAAAASKETKASPQQPPTTSSAPAVAAKPAKKPSRFSLASMTGSHERKQAEKLSSMFAPKGADKTHFGGPKVSNSQQDISSIIASVRAANQQK